MNGDCSRFIFNLPKAEQTTDRIFFHIQNAHWFYSDFYAANRAIIEAGKKAPRCKLKQFAKMIFRNCPFLRYSPARYFDDAFSRFSSYILEIPVYGAIILNQPLDKVLLVTNFKNTNYSFPKGKINQNETGIECAIREVWEETGINIRQFISEKDFILHQPQPDEKKTLYIIHGTDENIVHKANANTRNEIGRIEWVKIADIEDAKDEYHYKNIAPFIKPLKMWIRDYQNSTTKKLKIVTNPRVRASSMNDGELIENHINNYINNTINDFEKKLTEVAKKSEKRIEEEPPNPFKEFKLDKQSLNDCFLIKT